MFLSSYKYSIHVKKCCFDEKTFPFKQLGTLYSTRYENISLTSFLEWNAEPHIQTETISTSTFPQSTFGKSTIETEQVIEDIVQP